MKTITTNQQNNRTCVVCKQPFVYDDWFKRHGRYQSQVDNNCCDTCQHWAETALNDRTRQGYIIDSKHYYTGAELQDYTIKYGDTLEAIAKSFNSGGKNQGKGMGGTKHIIRMFRAKIVITDDLWHQGTVPTQFAQPDQSDLDIPAFIRRNPMTNNAEFVGAV